jgi:hypothetical protein
MPSRSPRDLADQMAARRGAAWAGDGYARETFTQPRDQARQTARAFLDRFYATVGKNVLQRQSLRSKPRYGGVSFCAAVGETDGFFKKVKGRHVLSSCFAMHAKPQKS